MFFKAVNTQKLTHNLRVRKSVIKSRFLLLLRISQFIIHIFLFLPTFLQSIPSRFYCLHYFSFHYLLYLVSCTIIVPLISPIPLLFLSPTTRSHPEQFYLSLSGNFFSLSLSPLLFTRPDPFSSDITSIMHLTLQRGGI